MVETRTWLNSVFSWDISQVKCLICYKEIRDALEMKNNNVSVAHAV